MYVSDEEYAQLPSLKEADALTMAKEIHDILYEKKAKKIKVLHVADKTVLCEYFVICTGNSSTHVQSLAGELEHRLSLRHVKPYHMEGRENRSWLVADYSHVIVHIFTKDARDYYSLEKLYGDAEEVEFNQEEND